MTLEDLVTIYEITQLKYRYLRAIDTQDWKLIATLFTEHARAWYSNGDLSANGRENIVAALSTSMKPSIYSSHIGLHPEITVMSATTAKGQWRFEDVVHFLEPDASLIVAPVRGGERLIGAGYYYDEYEKIDGQWKIASTGYIRLFEATEQPEDQPNMKARFEKARGRLTNHV
jgi:hypothetical protein